MGGEAETLTRTAVELALAGDVTALRLCLERVVPPRKDRAVVRPAGRRQADDAAQAFGAVLAAVAEGRITVSEASAFSDRSKRSGEPAGPEVVQQPAVQLNVSLVSAESRPE